MNAPVDTLREIVAYASDAVIPKTDIVGITTHHEGQHHKRLEETVHLIQGQTVGELAQHEEGRLIDESQFEEKNI